MIAEMPHASAGNVKGIKSAIHLSETALDSYDAPPKLGEHTHEVLTGLLGYTSDEVDTLQGSWTGFPSDSLPPMRIGPTAGHAHAGDGTVRLLHAGS
jgi:hypothetical protein